LDRRIALILPGGIASGVNNQGIPLFLRFCERLGQICELTVISLTTIDESFVPSAYSLYGLDCKHDDHLIFKERKFAKLFKELHKKYQFELLHGIWTSPSGLMAIRQAKKFGLKSIVSLQGGDLVYFPKLNYGGNRGWLKQRLNTFILDSANALTAETQFQAKNLVKVSHKAKLSIIYYGIEPSEFSQSNDKDNEFANPIRFIHVANLNVIKNQEFLIDVFAEINRKRPSHLHIIGPDYYGGVIQEKIKTSNLESVVRYSGYLPFDEIKLALAQSDVMLHTSHYESTGMSVIEAMASNVVVCGTNVGIMSDLKNAACFVSTNSNPALFGREVLDYMEDQRQMNRNRSAALQWTRENTMEKCVYNFHELYEKVLSE